MEIEALIAPRMKEREWEIERERQEEEWSILPVCGKRREKERIFSIMRLYRGSEIKLKKH